MQLLKKANHADKLDDMKVLHASTRTAATHSFGPVVRDHYFILHCVGGRGMLKLEDTVYSIRQGQGFCVQPETIHCIGGEAEEPWSYFFFTFHGVRAKSFYNEINSFLEHPVYSVQDDATFQTLNGLLASDKLSDRRPTSELVRIKLLSMLYAHLYNILDTIGSERRLAQKNYADTYVQLAIHFIKTHYHRKINVSRIAEAIGLNASYLGHIFKKQTKMTLGQYLSLYRIEKACEFMKQPSLSISDIARSVGYDDPLLFSKVFKRVKATPPSKWQDRRGQDNRNDRFD